MYTLEKNKTSPLCILFMLVPQVIPLLTLMLVCMWYKSFTLWTAKGGGLLVATSP